MRRAGLPGRFGPSNREPAYEGASGRTRLKSVHVPLPNGFVRTLSVYDVVNVGTDPHLREPALAGALHRFETGEELAVPFIFHDPTERRFVLVVPEVLRHEELRLRAKLMVDIAEHTEAAVPSYVRDAVTVVGVEELGTMLRDGTTGAARSDIERMASEMEIQADALAQRESRLQNRAEQVTRREDELRAFTEELEAGRADLAMREQELEARFEQLRSRETKLGERGDSMSRALGDASEETSLGDDDVVQLVDDEVEEVEEIDDLEPLRTSPGNMLSDAVEMVADPEAVEQLIDPEEEDVEEIVEDLEGLEEIEAEDTGVTSDPGDMVNQPTQVRAPQPSEPPPPPRPSVNPPPEFLQLRAAAGAMAKVEADGVRIFARLPEGKDDAFREPPDLLAQLVVVEECPVVILSLVEATDRRPEVVRAALNPRAADDRNVLANLRREFAARVVTYASDGRYLYTTEVEAPREVNAARIIERVAKLRAAPGVGLETAVERVLSSPPPVRAKDHPFVDDPTPPKDAARALKKLDALTEWSTHDKMDHALLVLSIPRDRVDAAVRQGIEAALAVGLPLDETLRVRAISLGIAADESAVISDQIAAFRRTTSSIARGGLDKTQIADAWEALLRQAAEHEVAIDAETHEIAWAAIRDVKGGDDRLLDVDASSLPEMGPDQLLLLLEHPRYRLGAALELAGRKDSKHAETLCRAVRKMPRAEVVAVVPKVLGLGDGAGDALIDGLGARKTFVRQAFALALAQLKLRRAVVPLVHLLASEDSDVWPEIARVVGSFGTASLRNVQRQLKDPKGKKERYILALSHLANTGCERQVTALTKDDRPSVAAMATEALAMRDDAKAVDEQVRAVRPMGSDDAVLSFSRRFYEELSGSATKTDLS